jgi:hypothetical protein
VWAGFFLIFPLFTTCSFYVPSMFLSSSQWVSYQFPNMFPKFPMCSPKVLPIAPCFNLICCAHNPPLLTKGGGTPSFNRIFNFGGASTVSSFFCNGAIKITHFKKKVGLMKHPQLININHTKRWISGGWLLGDHCNPPRTIQKRPSTTTSRSESTRRFY